MKADAHLPHIVHNVPVGWFIGHDGELMPRIRHYVAQGVVRVIAGPDQAHCVIDVQRPYCRPQNQLKMTANPPSP